MRTLEAMIDFDVEMQLILVLPENQMDFWENLCGEHNWAVPHLLANGGKTRFLSVQNGLELAEGELVGIHDGVRPFVSNEVME